MSAFAHTLVAASAALRRGECSCAELARHCLDGLAGLQDVLHTMITIDREGAIRQAEALDRELKTQGPRGPLHGIPFVNKDLFAAAGLPRTVGSPLFRHSVQHKDAAVVARLRKAGCVLLGQANLSEFASVPVGRNRTYGDVQNPWKKNHSPGTSSSGSAAALAAGLCLAATGSDTGNSIRTPASFCGVTGLRPTFGLVSLDGAFPRADSLDTAGPLARCVTDVALLLHCLAGHDPADPRSLDVPLPDYAQEAEKGVRGLTCAVIRDSTFADLEPEVEHAVRRAVDCLEQDGMRVIELDCPLFNRDLPADDLYALLTHEFSLILNDLYDATPDKDMFDPAVQSDMAKGRAVSRARYEQAMARRAGLKEQAARIFQQADVLITPATPAPAPAYDAPASAWDRQRRFLIPVSYLGLPGLSLPCGISAAGLPLGLQLVGNRLAEPLLLRTGRALERHGLMPQARPEVFWD